MKVGTAMLGWYICTLSVRWPQPHNTNPQKEREQGKTVEDKRGCSSMANEKALAKLLKRARPTPN